MMPTAFEHETNYSDGLIIPCVNISTSHTPFPLTPALSPRERENRSSVIGLSEALVLVESGNAWLPLPKGEGRGEGEQMIVAS